MRRDLVDVTILLDRSGSMQSCKADMEGGLNQFIEDQKKQPGETRLTLVTFDDQYEKFHEAVNIKDVPAFALVPRGMTALLDACGKSITETGERISRMNENDRPGLVMFMIITDGCENASKEYTAARVKEMIKHQEEAYSWKFTYLGANQDAFGEAHNIGIGMNAAANYQPQKARAVYQATGAQLNRMRGEVKTSGVASSLNFSEEDRKSMS